MNDFNKLLALTLNEFNVKKKMNGDAICAEQKNNEKVQ